jgi:hypothetical protein
VSFIKTFILWIPAKYLILRSILSSFFCIDLQKIHSVSSLSFRKSDILYRYYACSIVDAYAGFRIQLLYVLTVDTVSQTIRCNNNFFTKYRLFFLYTGIEK